MSRHAYPPKVLAGDYTRATAGLAVTAGPALLLDAEPAVVVILTALAALFGIFGLRTALRQATTVAADAEAVETRGPLGKRLAWSDVDSVRLDYFSARRGSAEGWMQMKISGRRGRIRIDSTIGNFLQLARTVAAATASAPIAMSDITLGNFGALGIELPARTDGGEP